MANTRVYWLHALSPTHVGTGRGVGYVDLPVDREGVTNWPIVRGSAFKGVWADHHRATADARRASRELRAAFGVAADDGQNNSNAGSLVPTDARLVCLPVRSFRGTFAWCTSRLALHLLHRTLTLAGCRDLPPVPAAPPDATAAGPGEAHVAHPDGLVQDGRVYLEDLDFVAVEQPGVTAWAEWIGVRVFGPADPWRDEFRKRFAVLPDAAFDFLTATGTEVFTRVKINDDTKTVEDGHLWTEEAVPAETIFAGLVACDRVFGRDLAGIDAKKLLNDYATKPLALQVGGKATVGRGQMRCVFTNPNSNGGAK